MRQWLRDRIVALLDNLFGAGLLTAVAVLLPLSAVTRAVVIAVSLLALLLFLSDGKGDRPWLPLGALGRASGRLFFQAKLALALHAPVTGSAPALPSGAASPIALDEPKRAKAKLRDAFDADLVLEPLPPTVLVRTSSQGLFGRNDPCWCGSSKKYKRCHGA
jgi:SEC-C motif